jgi:hypothetical protein
MPVHANSFECNLIGIGLILDKRDPLDGWGEMTGRIEASNLKVAPIFAHA